MIVYHGTTMRIEKPKILIKEIGRDFGFAFYTTDVKEQAERWAIRKAKLERRRLQKDIDPIVNVYEWDESDRLTVKIFDGASEEWLDMVVRCRGQRDYRHPYDVVIGKIANDNVGETVAYVMQGIMRKEDAIERLKFEKINNQIAFCTAESLSTIKFIESYGIGGR